MNTLYGNWISGVTAPLHLTARILLSCHCTCASCHTTTHHHHFTWVSVTHKWQCSQRPVSKTWTSALSTGIQVWYWVSMAATHKTVSCVVKHTQKKWVCTSSLYSPQEKDLRLTSNEQNNYRLLLRCSSPHWMLSNSVRFGRNSERQKLDSHAWWYIHAHLVLASQWLRIKLFNCQSLCLRACNLQKGIFGRYYITFQL